MVNRGRFFLVGGAFLTSWTLGKAEGHETSDAVAKRKYLKWKLLLLKLSVPH